MIVGKVSPDGVPLIMVNVGGKPWAAMIDTGFNGDLELPIQLKSRLKSRPAGRFKSYLAAGQSIVEDTFAVEFPFDGRIYHNVQTTFVDSDEILIGTHLIRSYRLEVDFPRRTVILRHEDEDTKK